MKNNKVKIFLMSHKRVMKYISNITFGIGAALGAYALIKIFVINAELPPGVCPLDSGRPILIAAVVVLGISLLASFFTEKKYKEKRDSDT